MDRIRLAVIQPRVCHPDERANVGRAVAYARQAASQGAGLVMFPECYPGPYSGPADYDALPELAAVARESGLYLGYGFMQPAGGPTDAYYNVYQFLGPDGQIALTYRKLIPSTVDPELSGKASTAGDELMLLDIGPCKVGALICWEAWFPELTRTLALQGADLVLYPTGGMLYHLAPVWGTIIQARATENLIYTASCVNLFGVEDGFVHVCAPEGELTASVDEGVVVIELDLARLRYLREQDESLAFPKHYKTIPGLLRFNRPELYGRPVRTAGRNHDS